MPPKAVAKKSSTASKTPAATKTYATKVPSSGTAKKAPIVTSQKKKRKNRKETWGSYIYKGNNSRSLVLFPIFFFCFGARENVSRPRRRMTWMFKAGERRFDLS